MASPPPSQFQGSDSFRYIDDHQNNRIAHLLPPGGGIGAIFGTPDPQWTVSFPDGSSQGGPYDWLSYIGKDGGAWQTKVNVSSGGGHIWTQHFESQHTDGSSNSQGSFLIVDWDRTVWQIIAVNWSPQGQPSIILARF